MVVWPSLDHVPGHADKWRDTDAPGHQNQRLLPFIRQSKIAAAIYDNHLTPQGHFRKRSLESAIPQPGGHGYNTLFTRRVDEGEMAPPLFVFVGRIDQLDKEELAGLEFYV